jgi:acyl carrier protein
MEVEAELNGIFREVFEDDGISITREMTANDVEGWDSLSHVTLIVAIETRFKIRFTQKEIMTFKNVGDLVDAISSKTAA